MPHTDKHREISQARTGQDYVDLHQWINHPQLQYERHDFTRIPEHLPEIGARFGEEGVREYIEHLRIDMEMKLTGVWGGDAAARDAALEYFGIRRKPA
jgi:hypothetical protein